MLAPRCSAQLLLVVAAVAIAPLWTILAQRSDLAALRTELRLARRTVARLRRMVASDVAHLANATDVTTVCAPCAPAPCVPTPCAPAVEEEHGKEGDHDDDSAQSVAQESDRPKWLQKFRANDVGDCCRAIEERRYESRTLCLAPTQCAVVDDRHPRRSWWCGYHPHAVADSIWPELAPAQQFPLGQASSERDGQWLRSLFMLLAWSDHCRLLFPVTSLDHRTFRPLCWRGQDFQRQDTVPQRRSGVGDQPAGMKPAL